MPLTETFLLSPPRTGLIPAAGENDGSCPFRPLLLKDESIRKQFRAPGTSVLFTGRRILLLNAPGRSLQFASIPYRGIASFSQERIEQPQGRSRLTIRMKSRGKEHALDFPNSADADDVCQLLGECCEQPAA